MKITRFAVERPVTTSMLFLGLLLFGILSYFKLPVNMLPQVSAPYITITTPYLGADPETIASDITEKIEDEVATISGIKNLRSYSMENISIISVEFYADKNADKALNDVKAKLELAVPKLPKEAEKSTVETINFTEAPVIKMILTGDKSISEIYDYADRHLKNRFNQLNGTSKVEIKGGAEREIKILADPIKIIEMNTSLEDLATGIGSTNTRLTGGDFINQDRQFSIETGKRFETIQALNDSYIMTGKGRKRLGDFAQIVDSTKTIKKRSIYYDNISGKRHYNCVFIEVSKNSTANAVQVAEDIKNLAKQIETELPDGMAIHIPIDDSVYTKSSVDDALVNVGLGILITGLILYFFLNNARTTLIVSISIPVSLIATFVAIQQIDGSLNMMTLMSFSVAVGALISNSIIVIDNILRLKREGMDIKEAAVSGTQEVMMAVIASTGTNLVVFLPIASMNSMTGAFFKEYALTISAATIISLIVSFMLTPMLASVLLKKESKASRFSKFINALFGILEDKYERSLSALIKNKKRPLILFAIMIGVFILTTELLPFIGFEFEPKEDNGDIYIELEMPSGSTLNQTGELLKLVEDNISKHAEVESIVSMVGEKNNTTIGSNYAKIHLKLNSKKNRTFSNEEFAALLNTELNKIPEIIPMVSTKSSDDSGTPLQLILQSSDQKKLLEASLKVEKALKDMPELLNSQSTYRPGNPKIVLEPKLHLMADTHTNPYDVALTVRNNINGLKASVFKEKGKEYDITLSLPNNHVNTIDKVNAIPVFTSKGTYRVDQLTNVNYKQSESKVLRIDKINSIEFSATPIASVLQGDAKQAVDKRMSEIELPSGVSYRWSGNIEEMESAGFDMLVTLILAIILMYMLLASLLENFWHPIIIFTTVPMAMIGVFLLMFLGGTSLNIMSVLAIITLLGLVVNDSILIHDYTGQLHNIHGLPIRKATLQACKTKMKTVIMTSAAIISGMLPNALGIGDAGAEYRTPMAIVTIGGMITATILTLYVIPSLFYIAKNKKVRQKKIVKLTQESFSNS